MDISNFNFVFYLLQPNGLLSNIQPQSSLDLVAILTFVLSALGYLSRGYVWDRPDPHYHLYFEKPQASQGATSGEKHASRNITQRLDEEDYRVIVFWGSQSGTSERFAEQLGRECRTRFGLHTLVADLSDCDPNTIPRIRQSQCAIFLLSTYGEGDPSDNAAAFYDWIKRTKNEKSSFTNLQYAAFGLGNSNYKYYNKVVDVVVEALHQAGASALIPVGKADDANDATEEDFQEWKYDLFTMFRSHFRIEEKAVKYEPTVDIELGISSNSESTHQGYPKLFHSSTCSPIRPLSIKNVHELFASDGRNCVHMELDLADHPDVHYKTGDHVGIWPCNPKEEVERLVMALGLSERENDIVNITGGVKVPSPTSVITLFRNYLEICGPVSRQIMLDVAQFAPTPEAKSRVLELGRDKERYANFVSSTHLTLARLLILASPDHTWTNLPLSFLIETIPALQPRYYSISSSSVISPRRLAITSLVSNKILDGPEPQVIQGLTSNYLLFMSRLPLRSEIVSALPTYDLIGPSDLLQGVKVLGHIRRSKFKLPITSSTPLVMIAAGTGFAPFRGFISERAKLHSIGRPVGKLLLFFGCRHPDQDFIYRDELAMMQKQLGERLEIVTAFSRLRGEEKVYVQDRIAEYGDRVVEMLEVGANLYICGKASMAREVDKQLEVIACRTKSMSDAEAKDWTDGFKRRGKWRADVWG